MKKILKTLFILTIIIVISAGCEKKDPLLKNFKNPKTIEFESDKGKIEISYDDDGNYEEQDYTSEKPGKILKNKEENFRIALEFYEQSSKELDKTKNLLEQANSRKIFDVEFRGIKGFASISKQDGTTDIFLYAYHKNDIIINIRISSLEKREITENNVEDILYNNEKVQQILKTIKYSQIKKK